MTIVEARDLKAVDKNGFSDPYVKVSQIYHGKERTLHKTDAVKKSLNPVWKKETFKFKAPPNKIRFSVRDKDFVIFASTDSGKDIGEVEIDFGELIGPCPPDVSKPFVVNKSIDQWFKLDLGGKGEIRLQGELKWTFK